VSPWIGARVATELCNGFLQVGANDFMFGALSAVLIPRPGVAHSEVARHMEATRKRRSAVMMTFPMIATPRVVRFGALTIAVAAALGLSSVIIGGSLGFDTAFAHPGGGGGGGGGGSGASGGGGGGDGPGGGNGVGGGNGHAPVGAPAAAAVSASSTTANQGSTASMLGPLNAAHASKTAYSHANPHSMVGKIAAYANARATLAAAEAKLALNPNNATLQAMVVQDKVTLTTTEQTLARARHVTSLTQAMITALNGLIGNK
jgi:hypothetical protein